MGISYNAVAMYGKYFRSRNELVEFVEDIYPDAEVDYESVYEVPELEGIEIECLDCFSGEHFIIGNKMNLGETIDAYKEKWDKAFPGVEAVTHLEVRIS